MKKKIVLEIEEKSLRDLEREGLIEAFEDSYALNSKDEALIAAARLVDVQEVERNNMPLSVLELETDEDNFHWVAMYFAVKSKAPATSVLRNKCRKDEVR